MSFSTDYSLDPSYDPMWSQDVAAYEYPQYEEQILNQRQGLSTGTTKTMLANFVFTIDTKLADPGHLA